MKWCMVAAMAGTLCLGSVAWAQEDDFDLDALLGDFESAEQVEETAAAPAEEPAMDEEVIEEAVVEEVVEEAAPEADPFAAEMVEEPAMDEEVFEEAVVEEVVEEPVPEADPFADMAAEEPAMAEDGAEELASDEPAAAEEDPFADMAAEEPAEAMDEEAMADEPAAEADPFADMAAEEPAMVEAVMEEAVAEEPAAVEEPVAEALAEAVMEPAEDDLISDLFAEDAAPAAEEAVPMADESADPFRLDEPMDSGDPGGEMDAGEFGALDDLGGEMDALEEPAEDAAFVPATSARKAAGEEQLSPEELQKIAKETAQQEELRRQNAEAEALQSSETGFRALSDGDYVLAENSFAAALKTLPDRPQNVDIREQISWGLAEAKYLRAKPMVKNRERLGEARELVDSALRAAPDHRGVQALNRSLTKIEKIEAMPKPPARLPETIEKAQDIKGMYDEAREWYMLKDYDRALMLFEQILLRDPYHKSAMRYIRKIEADKFKLATYEREARVQGMMTDVRRSWSPPIRAQIEMPADMGEGGGVDSKPASERLNEKMQNIIIPAVEFRQANINDVVNFLVEASIAADPKGEGVNIILNLGQGGGGGGAPAPAPAPETETVDEWGFGGDDFGLPAAVDTGMSAPGVRDITLNLRRITMLDAIKYITEVAGLKYRIEDSAVMITPLDAPVGNIITRMYPVQPSFMDVIVERQSVSDQDRQDSEFTSMGGQVSMTKSDVKEFFEKTGVKFPTGASITYNATISQLIVANTADNLETFERILQKLNVVPNQVEIEARFVEVDQNDLEELGLQWILNDNWEIATKNDGSGQRLQVNANQDGLTQGNRFFAYNSGNLNIEPASMVTQTANQTMLGGILSASSVLTNPEVTIVLQALSQHGGSDLLSAPRVTTRSGVNAQIQVVKEIIYPTEFDVTQPTMNTDGNVTMSPVVTPGSFETRETGVILNVTPTVGPDGYTIDLVMAPEVAELVDWIQYGSQITVETGIIGARQQNTYLFNMPQPIFTSRNVTTSIVIWDGQTVVMGGLIREELTTIKDKVPILGDIPLLGWLFRSEGQYSRKMNLLIFVTARLVDPAGRPIHTEGNMVMPGSGVEAEGDVAL